MPSSVEEFRDLIRLLEERPEWRADLRRLVLSDELLTLPEVVRELTEAQRRSEERLGQVIQAQQRTEAGVGRLEESVQSLRTETERRFQELAEAQLTLTRRVDDLREVVQTLSERTYTLTMDLGELKGSDLERRYRERPFAYFSRLIRQAHALSGDELNSLLDRAVAQRQLSEEEVVEVSWADAIVRGRRRSS